PEQAGQVLGMYRVLAPLFQPYDLAIDELTLTGRGSWRAQLDTGAVLELGRGQGDEVVARTERFLRTVKPVASQYGRTVAAVEGADLRHNEGYALRLRGVTTVVADPKKK
ncbi:MAG: cell division protein FtsQ/DivIB, partial [Rhizobacter sp.]